MIEKTLPKKNSNVQNWTEEKKRLLAEIDNLQKQKQEEISESYEFRNQDLITELLEMIDSLHRALQFNEINEETKKFLKGVEMIVNKFDKILKSFGVKKIENKIGDNYDPNLHQTIDSRWNKTYSEGVILKIEQEGYLLYNRVLRVSKVVINQKKVENKQEKKSKK